MTRFFAIFLGAMLCGAAMAAPARSLPPNFNSLAEQLAPLVKEQQQQQRRSKKTATATPQQKKKEKLSALEESFSRRANSDLRLFGTNQIGKYVADAPTSGEVQDDLVLGPGDKIRVTFRGQRDDSHTYAITPQGDLIVEGLEPIAASGLTVGALRTRLESETARHLLNSTVFVSVMALHQITVTVMGEVKRPGVYTLGPYQTVLDALALAHGVTPNGSLRQIKLLRGGKDIALDFYQLLLKGDLGTPIQLRSGDKIMVPVLGQSFAVAGDVKRPGIFERSDATKEIGFDEAMRLAGGIVKPGANRFIRLSLTSWGDEEVTDIYPGDKVNFRDGDILVVTAGEAVQTNGVQVLGHVRQPGAHALSQAPDLRRLIDKARLFREGIYPLLAVIQRINARTLAPELLVFSPAAVASGKENKKLQSRDRVLFFSTTDMRRVLNEKSKKTGARTKEKDTVAGYWDKEFGPQKTHKTDRANPLLTPEIIRLLSDHAASVRGAVLHQGLYPVAGQVALNDLLQVAGGLREDASKGNIEVLFSNPGRSGLRKEVDLRQASAAAVTVTAKDKVSVAHDYTSADKGGVTIMGEVSYPGTYDLRKGDTLTSLIERAGGMTAIAYAPGTVFMRESERRRQQEQFRAAAREVELAVAGYYMRKEGAENHKSEIQAAQQIARDLKQARSIGRITVESDPMVLKAHPEQAVLLMPGDKIYVPRRPTTVAVAGEVLSPASLQFNPSISGEDYIRQAGGTTRYADDDRTFVVFPDGSASPISSWSGVTWKGQKNIPIPPGSTIVVPRDPDPLDFLKLTSSVGNILSQLVVSTLAVTYIGDR